MGALVLVAAFAGLLAGLAAGGDLQAVRQVQLRWWGLIVAAWAVQLVGAGLPGWMAAATNLATYVLLLAALGANRHLRGIGVMAAGAALNTLVIAANGGRMPVDLGALVAGGAPDGVVSRLAAGQEPFHFLAGPGTRLWLLADVIPVPRWLRGLGGVYSVGDLLLALGFGVVMFYAVRGQRSSNSIRTGNSSTVWDSLTQGKA